MRDLEDELQQVREAKDQRAIARATPAAMQKNVTASFKAMIKRYVINVFLWMLAILNALSSAIVGTNLHATCIEGFYFAVRSDISHYHEPKVFCVSMLRGRFLKEVLGVTTKDLALKI
jgi:hypothetical protein